MANGLPRKKDDGGGERPSEDRSPNNIVSRRERSKARLGPCYAVVDVRSIAERPQSTKPDTEQNARMKSQTIPTVRTYMDRETHALSGDDDILVAVGRLIDEGVTGAPVVDDQGHVVGELSEFDCLRLLAEGSGGERARGHVRDFMSTEFTAVPSTMDVYYVAGMFLRDPAHRRFIVIDGQQLVGVVTRKDILRAVRAGLTGS
jgi:CBS domain-containing protein